MCEYILGSDRRVELDSTVSVVVTSFEGRDVAALRADFVGKQSDLTVDMLESLGLVHVPTFSVAVCANCKSVLYLITGGVHISHGICAECVPLLYPDVARRRAEKM